jgi:O-glycosyl hydrolase/beta-xylosidase
MKYLFFIVFIYSVSFLNAQNLPAEAFQQVETYINPVMPGDHPDLTLFKDGDDFYSCGSNFHFAPYLPILHSTDLVHWEEITRVIPVDWDGIISDEPQAGTWAGVITYFYGSYWIYFSNTAGGGQYFCKADNPAGPWSEPVKMQRTNQTGPEGYDNSIFVDDDGTPYMLIKPGQNINRIQKINENGHLTGDVLNLDWVNEDNKYSWAEGPVMCKRNGWYYYFIAGNVYGGQYVLRSQTLTDDPESWEEMGNFFEPVSDGAVTFRSPNHIAQPFQLDDGTWWTISHSYEGNGNNDWNGQGRQGLLNRVVWDEDGKPTGVAPTSTPQLMPDLPKSGIDWKTPRSDYFENDSIKLSWHFLNLDAAKKYSLTDKPGWLTLKPGSGKTHILHKEARHHYAIVTKLDFNATANGEEAGIYFTNGNESITAEFYSGYYGGKKIGCRFLDTHVEIENSLGNELWLKVERNNHSLTGYYSSNGITWMPIGETIQVHDLDGAQENYNWWVGTSNGLYASEKEASFDMYAFKDGFSELPVLGYNNYFGLLTNGSGDNRGLINSTDKGGWLMLAGVDLGYDQRVPAAVEVEAVPENGGILEIWIDNIEKEGTKLAAIEISGSGDENQWQKFSAEIDSISGQHDVYLRWNAGVANAFKVKSIRFVPDETYISDNSDVTIDMAEEKQIIRGFGGIHINSWTGQVLNVDMQEKAFDNDPGEIGLSIFRLRIDPNSNNWNQELPIAQYATEKGALVFASPWNPPSHMREVLRETQYGTDYYLLPEHYDDYVGHLNDYVSYMEENGAPLYAISVQNEPDWHSWTWWEPSQMLTFMKENAQDINCRLIAPESLQYRRDMIGPLLRDSIANSQMDILGTHLYGTAEKDFYYPLAFEKEKEIWMTEHLYGSGSPRDNDWNLAITLAHEINLCMDANMSAFVYWYIRRFYGLINDEGNITDKGYVMSQFSKFIRHGAHRVETNFETKSDVTTTAYKTDSSMVIVVVNERNTPVTLDYAIENKITGIDELTQFTSSETKKVVNDGVVSVKAGYFTATVDAKSITTFTSEPSKGGKYGNETPVASGGGDKEIIDETGSGVTVTLKGSESMDADGKIAKYSWSYGGYQVATTPDYEVDLSIGDYQYILTVTDSDGATDVDTVNISVFNNNTEEIWLEAECANVGDNWDILESTGVSNGEYLSVKPGVQALNNPSGDTLDHLVYEVHLTESGSYKLWGRTKVPSPDDDSFWVKVDDGEWANWNSIVGSSSWQWDDVHNYSDDSPVVYALDTGYHEITICFREDGAALDKLYFTNTGNEPSDMGGYAFNCNEDDEEDGNDDDDIVDSVDKQNQPASVKVYPNPATSGFTVESQKPFQWLLVLDGSGQVVYEKSYHVETNSDYISINMFKGVYLLQIIGDDYSEIEKLIVE